MKHSRIAVLFASGMVALLASTSSSFALERLDDSQLVRLRGGSPFTSTDCQGGGVSCTNGVVGCANGNDYGNACSTCQGNAGFMCSAPYGTWNPFDLNCLQDNPVTCPANLAGVCTSTGCVQGGSNVNIAAAPGCGAHSACHR